jgi:hypothetical protein
MSYTKVRENRAVTNEGVRYFDTYRVTGKDSDLAATLTQGLPVLGDKLARDPLAVAIAINADFVEGSTNTYDVTVEYWYAFPDGYGEGVSQPSGPEQTAAQLNASGQAVTVDVWRLDGGSRPWVFPDNVSDPPKVITNPDGTFEDWWDMGGEAVDVGGEPVGHFLRQITLQLPMRWTSSVPIQALANLHGSRNSRAFDVFAPDTVLFSHFDITRDLITGTAEGTLHLVWDPWYHMRQRVVLDQEGNPLLAPDNPPWDTYGYVGKAKYVQWYQPFKDTADLTQLLRLSN